MTRRFAFREDDGVRFDVLNDRSGGRPIGNALKQQITLGVSLLHSSYLHGSITIDRALWSIAPQSSLERWGLGAETRSQSQRRRLLHRFPMQRQVETFPFDVLRHAQPDKDPDHGQNDQAGDG